MMRHAACVAKFVYFSLWFPLQKSVNKYMQVHQEKGLLICPGLSPPRTRSGRFPSHSQKNKLAGPCSGWRQQWNRTKAKPAQVKESEIGGAKAGGSRWFTNAIDTRFDFQVGPIHSHWRAGPPCPRPSGFAEQEKNAGLVLCRKAKSFQIENLLRHA